MEDSTKEDCTYIPGALLSVFATGALMAAAPEIYNGLTNIFSSEAAGFTTKALIGCAVIYAAWKTLHAGYKSGGFVGGFFMPPLTAASFFIGIMSATGLSATGTTEGFPDSAQSFREPSEAILAGDTTKQSALPNGVKIQFPENNMN